MARIDTRAADANLFSAAFLLVRSSSYFVGKRVDCFLSPSRHGQHDLQKFYE